MTKENFLALVLLLSIGTNQSVQPYFPPQLLFFAGSTLYAIDEINQKAYKSVSDSVKSSETAYAMKNFPYANPDSPQSKYYVQLQDAYPDIGCRYETYWQYGGNTFNAFPQHWNNGSSFEIKNFIEFKHSMIHSNKSSVYEDYWYSNKTCHPMGKVCPCEEIYFRKGTDIPVRSTQVVRTPWDVEQFTTEYLIISMGKPDDKYFDPIIKDWASSCRDIMLGLVYSQNVTKVDLNQNVDVKIWLSTPPHMIHGNDTVEIEWDATNCKDCITWKPSTIYYTGQNFYDPQVLTITRVKVGPNTNLVPRFTGGGFNLVPTRDYILIID